jgi:hypothetical protein
MKIAAKNAKNCEEKNLVHWCFGDSIFMVSLRGQTPHEELPCNA